MNTARLVQPPENSRIGARLAGAHFADAWCIRAGEPQLSALGQFLKAVRRTPGWVAACMALRNRAVRPLGLKDLGQLGAPSVNRHESEFKPGDRVGIFTLVESSPGEVLLGDSDRHLDVVLSVHKAERKTVQEVIVTVTTVVHVHNMLGRLYMIPVKPMHRQIVPTILRAVAAHAA